MVVHGILLRVPEKSGRKYGSANDGGGLRSRVMLTRPLAENSAIVTRPDFYSSRFYPAGTHARWWASDFATVNANKINTHTPHSHTRTTRHSCHCLCHPTCVKTHRSGTNTTLTPPLTFPYLQGQQQINGVGLLGVARGEVGDEGRLLVLGNIVENLSETRVGALAAVPTR